MRIVIAPDKFKGTLTAREAADAMARAVRDRWPGAEIAIVPMADGGDGTLDALGGANVHDEVTGPLGEPVHAAWRLDGRAAVIESAAASGLVLAGGAEANDPWGATTRGVGELIGLALDSGSIRIVVGTGGVAATDGGRGAIEALGDHVPFAPGQVTVLTDTTTTFVHAAEVFGPQKGADAELVERLTEDCGRMPRTGPSASDSTSRSCRGRAPPVVSRAPFSRPAPRSSTVRPSSRMPSN